MDNGTARPRRTAARPRMIAVAATLFVAGGATAAPAPAAVGDLHVHAGRLPSGAATTVGPWSGLTDNAPAGTGSFGVSMSNVSQGWNATATLAPPPSLSIAVATIDRRYALPALPNHSQPRVETTWENRGFPYTGTGPNGGYGGDSGSGTVSVSTPSSLTMRVACVWFDDVFGSCATGWYAIDRLDLVLHDDEAPTITGGMTGELLDGAWKTAATGTVSVTAADVGAGVYRAWIRAGSRTVYAAADPASVRCRDAVPGNATPYDFVASALSLVPCRTASTEYQPSFNLAELGDGVHVVSMGIEDAGGNERTVTSNRTVRVNAPGGTLPDPGTSCAGGTVDESGTCRVVGTGGGGGTGGAGTVTPVGGGSGSGGGDGGGGGVPAPAPAPAPPAAPLAPAPREERRANGQGATAAAALTVRVDGEVRRRIAVRSGQPVVLEGRLTAPGGAPIAGASIEVSSARRGATAAGTPIVSGSDGSFRVVLPPGPSRTIKLAYRAFADDAGYADTAELDIAVRAGVVLRRAPRRLRNGRAVAFRGSIAGAPAGSRKVVEMQVRQGGQWLTFATTRLRHGRFSYRYRFTRTRQPTTYVFRTVVMAEGNWPYETGASNHVSVRVRP